VSAAAHYEVYVDLKVSRDNAKALAGSTKGLRQGLAQAERDQQRMRKAEAGRIRSSEREQMRSLAQRHREHEKAERRADVAARARSRASIMRGRQEARDARAQAKTRAEVWTTVKSQGKAAGGSLSSGGDFFRGIGTGSAGAWAMRAGAVITGILAGAVALGLSKGAADGLKDQVSGETFVGSTATTLQLYGFNKGTGDGSETAMFQENIDNAKWYQQELQRIADASPGDISQVTDLFEGAIPGMAGITQDAKRITDLTEKVTYLAGTIGDFQMVGAQTGQILQGGAGSEFKTWLRIQEPIRKAGIELKMFKQNQKGGAKLTEAFNKLDPASRLHLFEKGLEALGPSVKAYFEQSFDGITSQAKSSLITLRKEMGKGLFDTIKTRAKAMTHGGILDRDGKTYGKAREFASYLGDQMGKGLNKVFDVGEKIFAYTANNWQTIVLRAQQAGHYLVTGAKLAATMMAVRAGAGVAAGVGGGVLGAFSTIAQATTSIAAMGLAATVVAPLLLGMGIVFAGAGVLLGGAVAYLISNFDRLSEEFWTWASTSQDVIEPFLQSIDDLFAKFVALGQYMIGGSDAADMFTTAASFGTTMVETLTGAFSGLLGMTASVIEGFGTFTDALASFWGLVSGSSVQNAGQRIAREQLMTEINEGRGDGEYAKQLRSKFAPDEGATIGERAREAAASIRAGQLRFDLARADPRQDGLSEYMYNKMNPMGPPKPPPGGADKKPPKVNFKQVNHNTWHVRDTDPNAIVAGFNKTSQQRAAAPLKSALAMVRRA